ncbi:MAG TPA: hypothetical protein VE467_14240 [Chryseolinea sp.]|jgi:hypothetical protein|nr:hypothetical protein [Chryseolinea sp.]
MANPKETSRKEDYIEFTLKVRAGRKKDWIEFGLDLNPNDRLISISESFSSLEELNKIFKHVLSELDIINKRTRLYNSTLEINPKKKKENFNEGYEQNFKPEFGKIDRIIHRHNSPGVSSVSYNRIYNGDKKPL